MTDYREYETRSGSKTRQYFIDVDKVTRMTYRKGRSFTEEDTLFIYREDSDKVVVKGNNGVESIYKELKQLLQGGEDEQ